jgi:hypothetical protein
VFTAATPIEFRGSTALEADRIVVEEGAALLGEPGTLRALTIVATTGSFVSRGTLAIETGDDLVLVARGNLELVGPTTLASADRLILQSRTGNLDLTPPDPGKSTQFTLKGRNRVELLARGANGAILVERARVASQRIRVDATAGVSVVGTKSVTLRDRALLTTDPTRTGLPPGGGDVGLRATGRVTVTRATVDAARNVTVDTRRAGHDLCLSFGAHLESRYANGRAGRISLANVRGTAFDDGSTTIVGQLVGKGLTAGTCP